MSIKVGTLAFTSNCVCNFTAPFSWLGTDNGLSKFDKSTFTNFNIYNSPLSGQNIISLAIANNSDIWIGTAQGNGISVYNENEIIHTNYTLLNDKINVFPNPFSNQAIIELHQDLLQKLKSLNLFSLEGKKINFQYSINSNEIILYRGNLSNGLYFLKVQTDQNLYTVKLLVN